MDTIVTKTGASVKALSEIEGIMKNLARTIPTYFETESSAIGELNTCFRFTEQALKDLSSKFIKFAELNNTEVSTYVDHTQKIIAAFGLNTEVAGALLIL